MSETVSTLHVDGWTLVRLGVNVDDITSEVVLEAVREAAAEGAPVVIDLRHLRVSPTQRTALAAAVTAVTATSGRVAVVAADRDERTALTALGLDVHASLDAAVGNTAPVLLRASDGAPRTHGAPTSSDSILVTAEDITHSPGAAPPRPT